MMPRLTALAAALLLAGSVHAADKIKVGLVSTLSGPGAGLGVDIRDGFQLGIKHLGGKLGNLPAEVLIADDQQNPDIAKQAADKFLKKDKVDFMTGIVFSNIMLAVGPTVFQNQTFYISANAGPNSGIRFNVSGAIQHSVGVPPTALWISPIGTPVSACTLRAK